MPAKVLEVCPTWDALPLSALVLIPQVAGLMDRSAEAVADTRRVDLLPHGSCWILCGSAVHSCMKTRKCAMERAEKLVSQMVVSLNYCSQNGGNLYRAPYYNGNPNI